MEKILIVDDAAFMRKVTGGMLSDKYQVISAASGVEALALCETEKPDLILSDLIMPGMTGLELQSVLHEKFGEQIPLILITADDREETEARGLEGGAMDYIRKPFTKAVLLRRVDNILCQMRQMRDLRMVAETDAMTGLLNKAFSQKRIGELCRTAPGTLMMVDLDSFKLVNDLYGHGCGDKVLIRFADILRGVIRSSDLAGRMGGDEFILFCRDVREEEIVAEKTRQINERIVAAKKELMGQECDIPLGASIGAVTAPEEGTEFAGLFRKADQALYRVKQNGKHGYAVYRSHAAAPVQEKKTAASSLEHIRMILSERNRQKGAYGLSFDGFQSVFRAAVRAMENHPERSAMLALLTMRREGGETPDDLPFEQLLQNTLRRSDVFMRNGPGQFVILMPDTDEKGEVGLERFLSAWKEQSAGGVDCEARVIRAE